MRGEPQSKLKSSQAHSMFFLKAGKLDYGAIIFILSVFASLISIGLLAQNIFSAAQHLENVKRNGELVAQMLSEIGIKRKNKTVEFASCQRSLNTNDKFIWGPCWEQLLTNPEVARLTNPLQASNGVFGSVCDGSDENVGRIVIERGTPWFSAGTTGVTYAPSEFGDLIGGEVPMRIQVCNRWGEGIKINEIKF